MTQEQVILLAREAGFEFKDRAEPRIERFAGLVEQHLISQGYRKCAKGQRTTQYCGLLEDAVQAEREACAKICDGWASYGVPAVAAAAQAIRARGEQEQPR